MNTLSPLTELRGIGEKTEKLFAKVGVTNVGELLSYYPRTYETYGEIQKPDAVTDGMTAVSGTAGSEACKKHADCIRRVRK